MNLKEYNLVIIQVIPKCWNSNVKYIVTCIGCKIVIAQFVAFAWKFSMESWIRGVPPSRYHLSIEKHANAKPTLCDYNFTSYFESFVDRNHIIRNEILFHALSRDTDQVFFLRYKHENRTTVFCSGMPASSERLGSEFMRLQSTHIRIPTF